MGAGEGAGRGALAGVPVEVGDVLGRKYRVERLVGEGGTGVVVAATHLQLEQKVAIKFLRTALASDEVRLRFEREAKAIEKIQSEHVVLVLDAGTLPDGEPYMVMEYLEGRDLARVLREDGPLPVEDAVDCMLQVCEALAEAHAVGIVHRDLKPANLFLTRREDGSPHVKVVDFGISKILDVKLLEGGGPKEVTNAFTVLGSPRYMAPEQLRSSRDVDGRADLWSVGAVLFQLVTGKRAFDAETNTEASVAVLTAEPPSLCSLAPHAPPALEAVVRRCLEKDVTRRFQTAEELADALRPLASERTRESLERMRAAREPPSVQIAVAVGAAQPEPLHVRLHPSSRPPPSGSQPPPWGGPPPGAAPPASSAPARPSPGGGERAAAPARNLWLVVAVSGLVLVVVAFVVLSLAKLAAESAGLLGGGAEDEAPAVSALAPARAPVDPVVAPAVTVSLDAGRAPP